VLPFAAAVEAIDGHQGDHPSGPPEGGPLTAEGVPPSSRAD
jgi:hypothetical protein